LYAPDNFPYEDFLADNQQMTLNRAFQMLHTGVVTAYPDVEFADKHAELRSILDRSFMAYKNGDEVVGSALLNTFEGQIFKR